MAIIRYTKDPDLSRDLLYNTCISKRRLLLLFVALFEFINTAGSINEH